MYIYICVCVYGACCFFIVQRGVLRAVPPFFRETRYFWRVFFLCEAVVVGKERATTVGSRLIMKSRYHGGFPKPNAKRTK